MIYEKEIDIMKTMKQIKKVLTKRDIGDILKYPGQDKRFGRHERLVIGTASSWEWGIGIIGMGK